MNDIEKYITKIEQLSLWNSFEIKLLAFRSSDASEWKARFIYVKCLEKNQQNILKDLETSHFRLVHETRNISELSSLLNEIDRKKRTTIAQSPVSLELMTSQIKYGGIYQRTSSFPKDYGLDTSCFSLIQSGNASDEYSAVERDFAWELVEYVDLRQAVRNFLDMEFWTYGYDPSIVCLAPIPLKVNNIHYNGEKVMVELDCSLNIDIDGLEVLMYKQDSQDNQVGKGETLAGFRRVENSTRAILDYPVLYEDNVTLVRFKVRYLKDELEEHILRKVMHNMQWIRK